MINEIDRIFEFLLYALGKKALKMEWFCLETDEHAAMIEGTLDAYFKNKSPDCILYSKDGGVFKIHKEVFSQTLFLRNVLSSAKENCCKTLEILCPCSKMDLGHLVNFLYDGEIQCQNEGESIKIQENLNKIFGFPANFDLRNPNQASSNTQNCLINTGFPVNFNIKPNVFIAL